MCFSDHLFKWAIFNNPIIKFGAVPPDIVRAIVATSMSSVPTVQTEKRSGGCKKFARNFPLFPEKFARKVQILTCFNQILRDLKTYLIGKNLIGRKIGW